MKFKVALFSFLINIFFIYFLAAENPELTIAILGLGGRSQFLLFECLKQKKNIRVIAVADDNGKESFDFFIHKLNAEKSPLLNDYKRIFENTSFYGDDNESLKKIFSNYPQIDYVFVTSSNYKHFNHLNAALAYSSCKNIYIEKPLCRTLDEFKQLDFEQNKAQIYVGLTLRYSTMAKIIAEKLHEYKQYLGSLKSVKAWELVKFSQALTNFMMSWRRYVSLSGGLLLEKSIHDLDLALFFLQALDIDLREILLKTEIDHKIFKKSLKNKILNTILYDEKISTTLIGREKSHFQRLINFKIDTQGFIDWPAIIDNFFEEFPNDDVFDSSDIIPDYHKLIAVINPEMENAIDLQLEVDLSGPRPQTNRGMHFIFEQGEVLIDIMKSLMTIKVNNANFAFDLQTNNCDHADGDTYIIQTIFGSLNKDYHTVLFNDPVIKLATYMGLVSEQQALYKNNNFISIRKINNDWLT